MMINFPVSELETRSVAIVVLGSTPESRFTDSYQLAEAAKEFLSTSEFIP